MSKSSIAAISPAEQLAHWSLPQKEFVKTRAAEDLRTSGATPLTFKKGVTLAMVLNTFATDSRDDAETSFALNIGHVGTHSECAKSLAERLGLRIGYQSLTTDEGDQIVHASRAARR